MSRSCHQGRFAAGFAVYNNLPNEILQEIWEQLPPLDRLSISQACRSWRRLALATPRLWTRVAVIALPGSKSPYPFETFDIDHTDTFPDPNHVDDPRVEYSRDIRCLRCFGPRDNLYYPGQNLYLLGEIYRRSRQLPLYLSINWDIAPSPPESFFNDLGAHSHRISRIHFMFGHDHAVADLLRRFGSLPALRTLTAGYDEDVIQYENLPAHQTQSNTLPALTQVHIGSQAAPWFLDWSTFVLPGVTKLSLMPPSVGCALSALLACNNLHHLTFFMRRFDCRYESQALPALVDAIVRVPAVFLIEVPFSSDDFILRLFHDLRLRSLSLDFRKRRQWPAEDLVRTYLLPPNPRDTLSGPVHLSLAFSDGSYKVEVVDTARHRREVFLDGRAIRHTPTLKLWPGFIRKLTVASATVDAFTWEYFASGFPDDCTIPELTIIVVKYAVELDKVSLARISGLRKLCIVVQRHGLVFSRHVLPELIRSRPDADRPIDLLSFSATANFGGKESLYKLAITVLH